MTAGSVDWLPDLRPASIWCHHDRHSGDTIESEGEINMQYCLLMHYQEGGQIGLSDEDMAPARAAFATYADDLDAAGVLIGTQVLQPAVASTTLTAHHGVPQIQDGPFADTKERLGGVFVIEVPDLDAALSWARRCPAAAWGTVEIRPFAVTYARGKGWYRPG
ncbi:hypothetical protein LAUMK136_02432 [Mycobacterium attenuatum]|uniref:YCII-related domain-containing protein n=1 Tax=Mycobacterium attenuatum TaxID=2341086 RepID=A0A498PZE1_9MYCO|nr:hypothetical protein LAUMK136_02432 [Mycobacterium attenuatum]